MKAKIIVLLLVLSAVLLSGCVGDEQPAEEEEIPEEEVAPEEEMAPEEEVPEEEVTPEENETAEEEMVPEEEVTPEENETSEEEMAPEEEVMPEEEDTSEGPTVISPEDGGKTYTIRIDNFRASPSSLVIKEGDTVAWINFQDRLFTLVSEEGLFENQNLVYRRSYPYTFEEAGTYNFSVLGQGRMDVTITVEEP